MRLRAMHVYRETNHVNKKEHQYTSTFAFQTRLQLVPSPKRLSCKLHFHSFAVIPTALELDLRFEHHNQTSSFGFAFLHYFKGSFAIGIAADRNALRHFLNRAFTGSNFLVLFPVIVVIYSNLYRPR
jgi:hypothetical protein